MAAVGIIDYQGGNLQSVQNAIQSLGVENRLVSSADQLADMKALVMPGVGNFGDCVKHLQRQQLWEPVKAWIKADLPFFGICVGYQLLFEGSEESPNTPGLGVFPGRVVRFPNRGLKVPHMGWNALELIHANDDLWRNLPEAPHLYFVHSYFPQPTDTSIIAATTEYGVSFAAAIRSGNVVATQFHPEKSQALGLRILQNFFKSNGVE